MAAISQLFVPFCIVPWLSRYTSAIVLSWDLVSRYIATIVSIAHPYCLHKDVALQFTRLRKFA